MKEIILIDAGTGNLRSAQKALEAVGANVERTDDPQKVLAAKKVVLPGVGAFGDFMDGMKARGLDDAVKEVVSRGVPMLGICARCRRRWRMLVQVWNERTTRKRF